MICFCWLRIFLGQKNKMYFNKIFEPIIIKWYIIDQRDIVSALLTLWPGFTIYEFFCISFLIICLYNLMPKIAGKMFCSMKFKAAIGNTTIATYKFLILNELLWYKYNFKINKNFYYIYILRDYRYGAQVKFSMCDED